MTHRAPQNVGDAAVPGRCTLYYSGGRPRKEHRGGLDTRWSETLQKLQVRRSYMNSSDSVWAKRESVASMIIGHLFIISVHES